MRVLVTGSRDWDHEPSVFGALRYLALLGHPDDHLDVRHGKAHRGADNVAARWVAIQARNGWPVAQDPYPADWGGPCVFEGTIVCQQGHRQTKNGREWCPLAGHRRNQQMIDVGGVDLVVGFLKHGSSGTRDCLKRAERAGLPRLVVPWGDRDRVDADWLERELKKIEWMGWA